MKKRLLPGLCLQAGLLVATAPAEAGPAPAHSVAEKTTAGPRRVQATIQGTKYFKNDDLNGK